MAQDEGRTSRRRFLDRIIAMGGIAWLGSALYPVLRYLRPLQDTGPGGPVVVPAEKVADLHGAKRFAIVPGPGTRVLVLQDPRGELRAFSAVCTHEGCTVQYVPGESVIWCACHNGRFDLEGRVVSGPPPRPLPRFEVARDAEGAVLVRLGGART